MSEDRDYWFGDELDEVPLENSSPDEGTRKTPNEPPTPNFSEFKKLKKPKIVHNVNPVKNVTPEVVEDDDEEVNYDDYEDGTSETFTPDESSQPEYPQETRSRREPQTQGRKRKVPPREEMSVDQVVGVKNRTFHDGNDNDDGYDEYEGDEYNSAEYQENEHGEEEESGENGKGKQSNVFSKFFQGKKPLRTNKDIKNSSGEKQSFSFTKENQLKIFRIAIWAVIALVLFMGVRQILAPEKFPLDQVINDVSSTIGVSGFPTENAKIVGADFIYLYLSQPENRDQELEREAAMAAMLSPNVNLSEFDITTPALTTEEIEANTVDGVFKNPFAQQVVNGPTLAQNPIPIDENARLREGLCDVYQEGICRALMVFSTEIINPNVLISDPEGGTDPIPKPPEIVYITIPMVAVYSNETGLSVAVDGPLAFTPTPVGVEEAEPVRVIPDQAAAASLEPELEGFFEAWAATDLEKMNRYLLPNETTPELLEGLRGAVVLNSAKNNPNANSVASIVPQSETGVSNIIVETLPEEALPTSVRLATVTVEWLNPVTLITYTQDYTLAVTQREEGRWYIVGISGGKFW